MEPCLVIHLILIRNWGLVTHWTEAKEKKDQNILTDNRVVVNDLWLVEDMKINKCDLSIQQT